MATIGERLEEARKRQGISLREAAEATKIRSDFLQSLENNKFDFDLPDVYRRGFLKLYARFLKLDCEKVMTDYNAVLLGNSKVAKRENREVFGRMDLPEATKPLGGADSDPPFGEHNQGSPRKGVLPEGGAPADSMETQSDSSLYWKIGLIFLGGFVIVGLIFLLVQAIVGGSSDVADDLSTPPASTTSVDNTPTTPASSNTGSFKIIANADVLNVMVRQDLDNKRLFSGPMQAGQVLTIDREGPVRVVSSDIDKITIELNGKRITSPVQGIGQIPLGMNGAQ